MNIVVYPHALELGGSQLNAIELAAAMRDLGHEVVVFGRRGRLNERIEELGLEFVSSPRPRGRPSPPVMHALGKLVRRRDVEIVHGFEWTTALEAYYGAQVRFGVPAVATVMSMAVAPFIPHDLPLIVGSEQIVEQQHELGREAVFLMEPPVDVVHNAPGTVDGETFARKNELDPGAFRVVCVSRLAAELKLEGILAAIDTVARMNGVQIVVVGDGPVGEKVREHAARANARAGRRAAVLTGELHDPRPAYAAADVCLGMGGSALRSMAFAKPLIVQGEHGFWETLTPDSFPRFAWTGFYGVGDDAAEGGARLERLLRELMSDQAQRVTLGTYARELVERRYSLTVAAERQLEIFEHAREGLGRRMTATGARAAVQVVAYRTRRRIDSARGQLSRDDFNSKPVAALRTVPSGSRG